jgi:hypothetical protein
MDDEELLARFEAASLPEDGFRHRDHVRLVWLYLHRLPVPEVLARVSAGLTALARARGKPGRYHETVTWAYVFLVHERIARGGRGASWAEFAAANPDLLDWNDGVLATYYREETLRSDLAREVFVLPDRCSACG